MDIEELVRRYIDAWNRQDVSGLLELMYPGAAYYDAFWMESCVGRDLAGYFQDTMDEEPHWYEQVGDIIRTESGVVFRYSAHDRSGSKTADPILYGADILTIKDDRILTVTDMYCSPRLADLNELAGLVTQRHGVSSHMKSGLSALRLMRLKAKLADKMDKEEVYLDPGITLSKLAASLGCSLDQLSIVISQHFGTSGKEFLEGRRIEHARRLLQDGPHDSNIVTRTAVLTGFNSSREFNDKFTERYGITPDEFCRRHVRQGESSGNSTLH